MHMRYIISMAARRTAMAVLVAATLVPGQANAVAPQDHISPDEAPPTSCLYTATAKKINATTIGGQANVTCDRNMWIVDVNVRLKHCLVDLPFGCLLWEDKGVIAHCNWRNLPSGRTAMCPTSGADALRGVTKGQGYAIANDFAGTDDLGRQLSGEDVGDQHF